MSLKDFPVFIVWPYFDQVYVPFSHIVDSRPS